MEARSYKQHFCIALCPFLLIQLSVQSSQQFHKSDTLSCKGENKVIATTGIKIWSVTECVLLCKSSSSLSSPDLVSVYHKADFTCQCFNSVTCTQADKEIKKAKQNATLTTVTSVQKTVSMILVLHFSPFLKGSFQRTRVKSYFTAAKYLCINNTFEIWKNLFVYFEVYLTSFCCVLTFFKVDYTLYPKKTKPFE